MEIFQLKELAASVRTYLDAVSVEINHSQSLDAIAAIPGLQNWPEVKSFPQRVAAAKLDTVSVSRLAYRLERKYQHKAEVPELLALLSAQAGEVSAPAPDMWPSGPKPGVYLTTDPAAVDAVIRQYAEATDGGLVYTESLGTDYDGAIDLGDSGLWSLGLDRIPSGTLIVVGPVRLDQESWEDAAGRVGKACSTAIFGRHRVVVLVETPDVENLAADVCLLAKEWEAGQDVSKAVIGWVSAQGDMSVGRVRRDWTRHESVPAPKSKSIFPSQVIELLKASIKGRQGGILAFGSGDGTDNPASELVPSVLPLTDRFGPAARILPRHRGTMEKFDRVPEAVRRLPFLPSVESAYAQGYRRFVIDPNYTSGETIAKHVHDSIFLVPTYASDVESVVMSALRSQLSTGWEEALGHLLAAVSVAGFGPDSSLPPLCDLYVQPAGPIVVGPGVDDIYDFPMAKRVLRQEDQLALLVAEGFDANSVDIQGMGERARKRLLARLAQVK
jgi:hypothetical protein